jgi:hypothetical protein
MKNDVLPAGFEVERTEQTLGDYNCILDVVGKKNGKPTFIDWKVKNKCKLDYLDQELEKYRYDWKEARHYPWALSEVTGQRVEEYTVVIFVLGPQFRVVKRTYPVNWKVVERWAQGCMGPKLTGELDGLWDTMTYEEPWQSNACMGGQWPCEYLDACWTYDLDREKMKARGVGAGTDVLVSKLWLVARKLSKEVPCEPNACLVRGEVYTKSQCFGGSVETYCYLPNGCD